jgi:hypothetical protein
MVGRDDETGTGTASVLDADEVQGVLSGAFYTPELAAGSRARKSAVDPKRPITRSFASRSISKTSPASTRSSTS